MTTMALYIRTSTSDQDGQAQFYALRRAAEARRWGPGPGVHRPRPQRRRGPPAGLGPASAGRP